MVRPFLSLNMGAIVPSTAGSELFGHERGSFTGATVSKAGLFAAADSGTLFLDEIGLMPPDVQPRRFMSSRPGRSGPLGAARGRKIDVRFIAATDTDIEHAIRSRRLLGGPAAAAGALSDLLAAAPASARGLRGAAGPPAARGARQSLASPIALPETGEPWLAASTVAALAAHDWPGNVRELENVAGQIVVTSRDSPPPCCPTRSGRCSPCPAWAAPEPTRAGRHVAARTSHLSDTDVARGTRPEQRKRLRRGENPRRQPYDLLPTPKAKPAPSFDQRDSR